MTLANAIQNSDKTVAVVSPDFPKRAEVAISLGERALTAWKRGNARMTRRRLGVFFTALNEKFPEATTADEYRGALDRNTEVVTERAFPVFLTSYLMDRIRVDLDGVEGFREFASLHQRLILG